MPSKKALTQKQEIVTELSEKLKNSVAGVIVDYKGINVAQDTVLRKKLRESDVYYAVVKNTMLRFAVKDAGLEDLKNVLSGTTAMAVSADYVAAAKILCKQAEESRGKFVIKGGFVEGRVIGVQDVNELAKLPPKETLVAMVLGSLNAPIAGFANVLNANLSGLARVLNSIAEQKSA